MNSLSRLATIFVVVAAAVRGAVGLTTAGMWGDLARGLFCWSLAGSTLLTVFAGVTWLLCGWRPTLPPRPHAALPQLAAGLPR